MKVTVQEIKQKYYKYLGEIDTTQNYYGDEYGKTMDIDTLKKEKIEKYNL